MERQDAPDGERNEHFTYEELRDCVAAWWQFLGLGPVEWLPDELAPPLDLEARRNLRAYVRALVRGEVPGPELDRVHGLIAGFRAWFARAVVVGMEEQERWERVRKALGMSGCDAEDGWTPESN